MAKACATCRTRLLVLRGFPPLDHKPSADGKVAVTFTDPVQARWLARDEQPGPLEKRHGVHVCPAVADPEPQRHADHGPEVTCRPAGNGLCETLTAQQEAFCWCHARWGLTAAAAWADGTCGTCHGRSPSACERAHSREAQGL